jgi:uncharacterized protein YxjI
MSDATGAGWHPDPFGRYELRYWDGTKWTEHVSTQGQASKDTPSATPASGHVYEVGFGRDDPSRVAQQVQKATGTAAAATANGGGTIFSEPVLVVNQKAKLIEVTNQYAVFDQHGRQVAAVNQVGQSAARKVLRFVSNVDQFLTHHYQVTDSTGAILLNLTRPAKVFKSTVVVSDAQQQEIGRIVQENMIGKIRFGLEAGGNQYGSINAENWRAWNFNIQDHTGTEIARITKTWAGLAAAAFTTADKYVVQIHRPLEEPLRSLVVAAALTVDTALKQDEK